MTPPYWIGLAGSVIVFAWTVRLVHRGLLNERFAFLWLAVSCACLLLAAVPDLLLTMTRLLHFSLPVNLLFVGASFVQLLVGLQLSIEAGRRQSENRRLAEELAVLAARLEQDRSVIHLPSESPVKEPTDT